MTYSLRTLTNPSGSPESDSQGELNGGIGLMRFTQEIVLFLGAAALLLLVLSMFSFSPKDPSWSGSGLGGPVRNWMGTVGAWLADGMYFCFGYSAWWLVAILGRFWLNGCAQTSLLKVLLIKKQSPIGKPVSFCGWACWCSCRLAVPLNGRVSHAGTPCCLAPVVVRLGMPWAISP